MVSFIEFIEQSIELEIRENSLAYNLSKKITTATIAAATFYGLGPIVGFIPLYNYLSDAKKKELMNKMCASVSDKIPAVFTDTIAACSNYIFKNIIKVDEAAKNAIDTAIIKYGNNIDFSSISNKIEYFVSLGDNPKKIKEYLDKNKLRKRVIEKWISYVKNERAFNELVKHYSNEISEIVFKPYEGRLDIIIKRTFPTIECDKYWISDNIFDFIFGDEIFIYFHLLLWFSFLNEQMRVLVYFNYDYRKEIPEKYINHTVKDFFTSKNLKEMMHLPVITSFNDLEKSWKIHCQHLSYS